jgi:hypothetical protein
MLPGGLIWMIGQLGLTRRGYEQKVTYPCSKPLEFRVAPLHLLELGCQLAYHLCVGSVAR